MVFIDLDVLLLAFAFRRDERRSANTLFLQSVQSNEPAITIYNLMEILGNLSFNLSPQRLDEWQTWLVNAYQLKVI